MAEFRLGRIKFVWKGDWTPSTSYVVDDVVNIGGKSYICVINHTSASLFVTDSDANPPKWNLVSDGTSWQGDWDVSTYYNKGDQVKYGGLVYICLTSHTSAATTTLGLEADQSKWEAFAESFYWTGEWATSTRYRVYDFVSYGGITYICNTAHTSAATASLGLEADQSKWTVFNSGLEYLGVWNSSVRYKINDIVKYGANTWICTTQHTSSTTFDDTKWGVFVEGLQFEDSWSSSTVYQEGDVVTYGGYSYIATQNHTNQNPSTATAYWDVYTTGFNFNGDWVSSTAYKVGDVVRLGSYTYLAIADNTNQEPPNLTYWNRLNTGIKWTNVSTTYTGVSGTSVSPSIGSAATFDITRTGTVYTVVINNTGTNYSDGDQIVISGTSVGGISPANDLTLTVDGVTAGAIDNIIIESGYSVTWTVNHDYVQGDAVFFGANSYICVLEHTASLLNRPDADTTATYWNLLAAGSESAVLTTAGDTYYYGTTGPTRLPVGTEGQILRVSGGYPTWAYYGVINNLVYVAPLGTDSLEDGQGLTIDKPWKTVRYACEQIEKGYRNRQATELLAKNKQFIMKEVSNWVTNTYSVAITASSAATNEFTADDTTNLTANMPIEFSGTVGGVTAGTKYFVKTVVDGSHFTISSTQGGTVSTLTTQTASMTGSLSYDYDFCQRDVGLLVDALIYDIGHGGNEEATKAAKAYYTTAGSAYINSNFGQQITQTVAAYNYMKDLVEDVLNNNPPEINYQLANGVALNTAVAQIIDSTLTAEADTVTTAQSLLTIVTDGILAGTSTAIPAAVFSNTTISVKTGTFYEVLPIVLPKNTAVVGDELRSTVISPKPAIANLVNDKPKTISALERIKAVAPNLVANNSIVPTEGNTATQEFMFNVTETIALDSVTTNIASIKAILENGLSSVPAFVYPTPTGGTGNAYDADYYNAARLILANKSFIQSEVSAWINAQISGNISPFVGFTYGGAGQTACERDVGYIVDALVYDLTYGGNLATQVAARSYYSKGIFVETGEKDQALAVQTRIKSFIDNIAVGNTAGWTKTTSSSQVTSGTPGGAAAGTFAQARIQEMYDTINTGTEPTTIAPSTSWVRPRLLTAFNAIVADKTNIQIGAIAWINANYPTLDYDQALCSRDVGYMVDALAYDVMFGSNFMSAKAGMAYQRGLASTGVVLADQLPQTLGTVDFVKNAVLKASAGTDTITSNIGVMTDILSTGLTAVPTFDLPTPTGGSSNAYTSGYFHAARLILANKAFLKAEVTAWINVQIAGSVSPFSGFIYDATTCERDVGYIVDALTFDLTYGGNLATQIAARSYYSNGVLVEVGEKSQALALWAYVKTIIDDIAKGLAITPSSGNVVSQVTSGTAGSAGAATDAQTRIQELYDTINTGTEPTTVAPDITWVASDLTTKNTNIQAAKTRIKSAAINWINATYPDLIYTASTCSRDVGYIIDALCYDLMFGSNFLSSWNAMSYYRGITSTQTVIAQQLLPTIGVIGFIGASVKEITTGVTGSVGNSVAIDRIELSANTAYDILNNGLDAVPAEVITDPTNLDVDFLNARTQIANNYAFIKADVSRYIQNNYAVVWTALGATGQAACQRDIGYILDAIRYDLTYGGNTQTLIAGSAYYSGLNLTISSSETAATVAAYTFLKSIIDDVAQRISVTPQSGNTTPQVTSGTGGDATAAAFAQARVQDIIDWINNGEAGTAIAPDTSWVDPALVAGFNILQDRKSEIQLDGTGYVQKFHHYLSYDETTCSRDIGYMVDGIGYDMMFGSNFAAITIGRSYHRAISSTAIVLANQLSASLGLIKFLKYKLKGYAVGGAVAQIGTIVDDIVGTIDGGAVPRFLWPDFTGVDAENYAAAKLIYDNKDFITAETLKYINTNYPAIVYSKSACARDTGYIIDALRYDLTYGGHFASKQAGIAYYSRLTSALQIDSGDKTATLAAYANMKSIVTDIANGGLSSYSALQTNVSYVTGTGGDATSSTRVGALMDVITNIIDTGLTTGVPRITITTIASGTTFTSTAHGLSVGDEVIAQTTANGLVAGTTYYVKTTPLTSTFTLAATYDGTELTSFTNGTGLSIAVEITNLPSTSWVDTNVATQAKVLSTDKASIQSAVTLYIDTNYPNLDYNSATCARDVGYILDALRYDILMGSNFRSIKAGMSYYQAQASLVIGDQKRATLNAYRYLRDAVNLKVESNATALASAKANMDTIIAILDKGVGETPDVVGTTTYHNDPGHIAAAEILRANKTFLENEATAWISYNFGGPTSGTSSSGNVITTTRAHNLSVGDPVKFLANQVSTVATDTTATGNIVTVLSTTGMTVGSKITFTGTGIGNIVSGVTYYILTVESDTEITISASYNGSVFSVGTGTGEMTVVAGAVIGGLAENTQYYVLTVPSTTTFTIGTTAGSITPTSVSTDTGTCTAVYSYDEASCKRDMGEYIDSIIYDINLPGNYKGTRSAVLYNNAVAGSELSDMFQVSNASGLRNCTLSGLNGDLTAENDYGTKRPTGGAYVALNPGFGPWDSKVWVTSRSHYSQNVTMFGVGCTGAKIDAALHARGNKSMVKNDFTTIMSDGIGVWCTGSDSLTELVSVFNYYGYAGYLAELGGRIRATNGNSSYGTYGVIAEGVDVSEVPLYGTVDNQAYQAQITNTVTDALSEVLRLEFGNAGTNYTNTTYTISGSGYNIDAIGDEFRDNTVFESRIIDLDDDNGVGGTSYVTASNAAQSGDKVSITIAATDTALSAAYTGMRIQLTAGTGVGQYANILTYQTGSKIAQVYKDSFTPLTATNTTVTTNLITVASTVTLYDNMPVYFSGTTFGGVSANTAYYVIGSTITSTQFKVAATSGSSTPITLSTASGSMTMYEAGWDHTVPGKTIENTLDLTTQYIIEPRISYTAPGYTATARTLSATATWKELTYGDSKYVAIASSGTTTSYSANGTTWATAGALSASASWVDVVYGGGEGARATAIIGGLGGQGAVFEAVLGVANTTGAATADQVASVNIISGGQGYTTPPVIVFTPVSGGTGAVATCAVLDGEIVSVTVTIPGTGYTVPPTVSAATDRLTQVTVNSWGRNYTGAPSVTVSDPFTGSAWSSGGTVTTGVYIYYVDSGDKNWYYVTSGGTFTTSGPIHTSGSAANGTVTLTYAGTTAVLTPTRTNEGVSGFTVTDTGKGYTTTPTISILDTGARYVAIATSTGDNCYTTSAGILAGSTWTAGTSTGKTDLAGLAYGGGVYVAVGGTASAVSSTSGSLWTSRTIPTLGSGTYSSVAYGAEMFVAISTGNLATAYSSNGTSWTAGGNLPASLSWTSVAYGNGRFVAIASGSKRVAYSIDRGTTWLESPAGLPASTTWSKISYGQGLFFAVATGGTTAATSPDGVTWTLRAMPSSSNWTAVQFGNISSNPLWVAASATSGTVAASIRTGAQATGRAKVASGVVTEIRMLEPGSGYPKGTVTATTVTTNLITVDNTTNLVDSQPIEFYGTSAGGLVEEQTYYVIGSTITSTQFKVSATQGSATPVTLSTATVSGMTYRAGPIYTLTDPNKVKVASLRIRMADGALGNPSFVNRGADNTTATSETQGDGYSDLYQPSNFINIAGLYDIPEAGANVEFDSLPGVYFKLVVVTNELGELGDKTAQFQINPALTVLQAPRHGDRVTTRIKYSQVRLTGHDFLYIGTGNKEQTNYPNVDISTANVANQAQFSAGGRVFFTSTDQDGNFNVGNLFGVQQATGTATLNASAFNLSGLNSLQLGSVELGIGSAIITQFSTDPFFTADSDSVVPTQRAIKAYITAQIGGGQSSLNVNTLTSGIVYIAGNSISTTTGEGIKVTSKMNFTGGIDGAPVALGFFMQR